MRRFGDASTAPRRSSNCKKMADLLGWNRRRFRHKSDPTAQPDRRVGRAAAGQGHESSSFAALSISRASLRRSRWRRLPGQACIPKARPSPPRTLSAGARQGCLICSARTAVLILSRRGKVYRKPIRLYETICIGSAGRPWPLISSCAVGIAKCLANRYFASPPAKLHSITCSPRRGVYGN